MGYELWSLDTAYANGAIVTKDGVVVRGWAPIFNHLIGQAIARFPHHYNLTKVGDETDEEVRLFLHAICQGIK